MFLSERYLVYVILWLVGNFESHHYGVMNATARESRPTISTAITTTSFRSTSTNKANITDLRQEDGSKTVGNFNTEAIFTTPQISKFAQTQTLEIANTSSKESRLPWTTQGVVLNAVLALTSYTRSPSTLEATSSIRVSARPSGGVNRQIETIGPSNAVSSSQYSSSVPSNSTANSHVGEGCQVKNDCFTEATDTYVSRWVDFYLNVGGWIMLSVVLVGITVLTVTHIHGRKRRKEIRGLPQLMYREMFRYRDRWV